MQNIEREWEQKQETAFHDTTDMAVFPFGNRNMNSWTWAQQSNYALESLPKYKNSIESND